MCKKDKVDLELTSFPSFYYEMKNEHIMVDE